MRCCFNPLPPFAFLTPELALDSLAALPTFWFSCPRPVYFFILFVSWSGVLTSAGGRDVPTVAGGLPPPAAPEAPALPPLPSPAAPPAAPAPPLPAPPAPAPAPAPPPPAPPAPPAPCATANVEPSAKNNANAIADTFMVALLVRVEVPEIFRSCVRSCFCCDQMHRADIDNIGTIPRAEAKAGAAIVRRSVGSKT
jgi:hypothetical protein